MRRDLSSSWTFFYKVFLPVVWTGVFAVGTAVLFLAAPQGWRPSPPPPEMPWVFLVVTVVGGAGLGFFGRRLKNVALEDGVLIVSDSGQAIRVPLQDIDRASGSVLVNPELVWVHFRRPTEFGMKIAFLPPWRLWRGFSPHPLAAELTALARQAAGSLGQ